MAQARPDNTSKLTPINEARLELFLLVKENLQADDPAPWRKVNQQEIDWNARGDADGYTLGVKQNTLAMGLMKRALLLGDLTACYYEDGQEHDLPAWIWEEVRGIDASILAINPLLPDQWWSLSGRKIYLGKDALRQWLKSINWKAIERSPDMPAPFDVADKPLLITVRDLPSRVYVSLTEAMSWVAFGMSLDHMRLEYASVGYDSERELLGSKWQEKLKDALNRLIEKGLSGEVGFVGKYVDHMIDHGQAARSESANIEPLKLNDYAKYDSHTGGLQFGNGLAWIQEGDHSYLVPSARDDGFRDVKVKREGLMREFSNSSRDSKPKKKRGRKKGNGSMDIADEPFIQKMRVLIESGEANSPHGAAVMVAPKAKGASEASTITRLAKRYRDQSKNWS